MFLPHKSDNGAVPPWEYLPAAEGTYQPGQLMKFSGGKLTAVSAACTTTPGFLCVASATITDGDLIPVTRVQRDLIYETQLSADAAGAAPGTMLQVSAGGLTADAGAAGTFEITYLEDTAAGSAVYGRFR